jgi:hypothetical protein
VRIRVLRRTAKGTRRVLTTVRTVKGTKRRVIVVRVRLRPGRYRIEVAPGVSARQLGPAARRALRVVR